MKLNTLENVDPGVASLVAKLRAMGWDTTDSGDGKTKIEAGDDEALDVPHVHMVVDGDEMIRLAQVLLKDVQCLVSENNWQNIDIQASYSPIDDVATLSLYGIDDEMLKSKNKEPQKKSYEDLEAELAAAVAKAERLGFAYDESTQATNALEQAAGYLGVDLYEDNEVIAEAAKKMRDDLAVALEKIEDISNYVAALDAEHNSAANNKCWMCGARKVGSNPQTCGQCSAYATVEVLRAERKVIDELKKTGQGK